MNTDQEYSRIKILLNNKPEEPSLWLSKIKKADKGICDFMCFYCGVQEYKKRKINESLFFFNQSSKSVICENFSEFIESNHIYNENFYDESIDLWSKTNLAKNETKFIVDSYINMLFDRQEKIHTFVDIGCGNGMLTSKIIDVLLQYAGNQKFNVVIIDKNQAMLDLAEKRIKGSVNLNIKTICSRLEDIDLDVLNLYLKNSILNLSSIFHEVKTKDKELFLDKYRKYFDTIIISELASDHDIVQNSSLKLSKSVYDFYSGLLYDTYFLSDITPKEAKIYSLYYLIPVALGILSNAYGDRVNYHLSKDKWLSIIRKKWNVKHTSKTFHKYLPEFCVFELRNK
jgi:SAM-dependent methyltransferase